MKMTNSTRILGFTFIALLGALAAGCAAEQPIGSTYPSQQSAAVPDAGCPDGQSAMHCHGQPGSPSGGPVAPVGY
jgi:hypothetical protein